MKVVKPMRQSVLMRNYDYMGEHYLSIGVLTPFRLSEHRKLLTEKDLWSEFAANSSRDGVLELGLPKEKAEFLVYGDFYSPGGEAVGQGQVKVVLGKVAKTINVYGNRYWKTLLGASLSVSDPEPITQLPVSYSHAFGGADSKMNPVGKGMDKVDVFGEERLPLPNLENPDKLIGSPNDRPMPAALDAVDVMWEPRSLLAGTYDEKWQQERFPGFADDMDWAFHHMAAEDQRFKDFLQGDEAYEIYNMHPQMPVIKGQLPGVKSRCFIVDEEGFREVPGKLDTVIFMPGLDMGVVLWRCTTRSKSFEAHEIEKLLLAYEALGEERSLEHYQEALRVREDDNLKMKYMLSEEGLIASWDHSGMQDIMGEESSDHSGAMEENARNGAAKKIEDIKAQFAENNLEIPEETQKFLVLPEKAEKLDAEKLDVEKMIDDAMKQKDETLAKKDAMIEQAAALANLSPSELLADAENKNKLLPRYDFKRVVDEMHKHYQFDKELEEKLLKAQDTLTDTYRRMAHLFLDKRVHPEQAEKQEELGSFVSRKAKEGGSITGYDLSGLDLTDLSAADLVFEDCLMEYCTFRSAKLKGVQFVRCVLTHCDFSGATMSACSFEESNLGGADLSNASLDDTAFVSCKFEEAVWEGATIKGGRFKEFRLEKSKLKNVSFEACELEFVFLNEMELSSVSFIDCTAKQSTFYAVKAHHLIFNRSNFSESIFVESKIENLKAEQAQLDNIRFVFGCELTAASFKKSNMPGSNFRGCTVAAADFSGAILDRVDFSEADLSGTSLHGVHAHNAVFMNTNLTGADMSGSDFMRANFMGATLVQADLNKASLYESELMNITHGQTRFGGANLKMTKLQDWRP